MGAINLGTASALYGGVRGIRDEKRDNMESQAFDTDQAIRRQRLQDDQEQAPLRKRSLELGVAEQERQAIRRPKVESDEDTLRSMNIDASKLGLEERTATAQQAREARDKEEILKAALGDFHHTGDPQTIANAMNAMYPKPDGTKPIAKRNPDGSITLSAVNAQGEPVGKAINLEEADIGGTTRSPDDQLAMYAFKLANPVEHLRNRLGTDLAIEKEGAKQDAITDRMTERQTLMNKGALERERIRSKSAIDRGTERAVRFSKSYVDSSLKTVSVPGHFTATYSSEDDAKLLPHIYKRAGELVRNDDLEPEDASQRAINEIRTQFLGAKKDALAAAEKLRKAGVDPRDKDALAKARAAGNADVDVLLGSLGKVTKAYGQDVGNYLLEQIPAKKK